MLHLRMSGGKLDAYSLQQQQLLLLHMPQPHSSTVFTFTSTARNLCRQHEEIVTTWQFIPRS